MGYPRALSREYALLRYALHVLFLMGYALHVLFLMKAYCSCVCLYHMLTAHGILVACLSVCSLVESNHPDILGEGNANLGRIISIFSMILETELCDQECATKIKNILVQVITCRLYACKWVCIHECLFVRLQICVHACVLYTCMSARMHVCLTMVQLTICAHTCTQR